VLKRQIAIATVRGFDTTLVTRHRRWRGRAVQIPLTPLRYQAGERRSLLSVEERFFTDFYPWRLFRMGYAAFLDVGSSTSTPTATSSGWLKARSYRNAVRSFRGAPRFALQGSGSRATRFACFRRPGVLGIPN
jgi:hypothetical protein